VDSQTLWIVIAALVIAVAGGFAWAFTQQQRRRRIRERFGPEYDRALREAGTPQKADALLEARARRVQKLKLRSLSPEQRDTFAREWQRVQAMFVDDPDEAVAAADRLVSEVMAARGYPLDDFETRAADLSVDHPRVVDNYRTARNLADRRRRGEAGTEELRQAVVNYRALFEDLLDTRETDIRRRAS